MSLTISQINGFPTRHNCNPFDYQWSYSLDPLDGYVQLFYLFTLLILILYVQFLPDILSLQYFYLRISWMNWINAILSLLDKYLGQGLVLGVGFPLWSGWLQKAVLLLLGGYIFSGILSGSEYFPIKAWELNWLY